MKKILLSVLGSALILSCVAESAQAQPCNSVASLGINTGFNYTTNTVVPTGQPDPEWRVTALTAACASMAGAVSVGSNARVCTVNTTWVTDPDSKWISFLNAGTYDAAEAAAGTYMMTLSRDFRVCQEGNFVFELRIANDNYCPHIDIDGSYTVAFSQTATIVPGNYSSFTTIVPFTVTLSAGVHTINVRVGNLPTGSTPAPNPHGLLLKGTISSVSGASSLVGPGSTKDCLCATPCSDSCYWKVTGNNIIGGNNIFGTLNASSIQVKTNSNDRGIITQGGSNSSDLAAGRLGWNTMNPTARLHVNCRYGNNPDNKVGDISDIRFEQLEPGNGTILVIDANGYVYNSKINPASLAAMADQIATLKTEIATLKSGMAGYQAAGNALKQNTPNPFSKETVIEYSLQDIRQSAAIIIYDLNGKEMQQYPLSGQGNGKVIIRAESLNAGVYLYTLVVDGNKVDTKKMVLTK